MSYPDESTFEQINRYLKGELPEQERSEFEALIIKDNTLSEEVAKIRFELSIIEDYALKKELDVIHEDLYGNKKSHKLTAALAIAASLIFLLGLWFLLLPKTPSHDELYSTYFSPYKNLLSTRNDYPETNSWSLAMHHYSKGEYQKSLEYLDLMDYPQSVSSDLTFYEGICLMGIGKYDKAIIVFETLLENESGYHQNPIHWYLGLSYLKVERNDDAIIQLKKIEPGEFMYSEALVIIEYLEET